MELIVFPSSRNIRHKQDLMRGQDGFIPSLTTMSNFQKMAIKRTVPLVDPMKRVLLLREGAKFKDFENLKMDEASLISFFTKSEAIFKFLEEVGGEKIALNKLKEADPYAEYEKHIDTLKTLKENYRSILLEQGVTDKMFIYEKKIELNTLYLKKYSKIEIVVEGYLTKYEVSLLKKVAETCELIISVRTSTHSKKIQEAISTLLNEGEEELPQNAEIKINVSEGKIENIQELDKKINVEVFSVKERSEQVALAFTEVDSMVKKGIKPENIALVLPDESFKEQFMVFDHFRNLNFAMGKDYKNTLSAKKLNALNEFWQNEEKSEKKLKRYNLPLKNLKGMGSQSVDMDGFFSLLAEMNWEMSEAVEVVQMSFKKVFKDIELPCRDWLFLWTKALSKLTIDDIGGGKITVLGVLETRGMAFEGVVIVDFTETNVPAKSPKDAFLSTEVRIFSGLPTQQDRESLQKHYYKRLLEDAKEASVIYSTHDNELPSRFIYELGLRKAKLVKTEIALLYPQPSKIKDEGDITPIPFDPAKITWSPSRLKTFLDCKRKYYNRYIEKAREAEEDEPNEGRIIHSVFEKVFSVKKSFTDKEELKKEILIAMENILKEDTAKNTYRKMLWISKMEKLIDKQITHFAEGWTVQDTEFVLSGEIGGLSFSGRVDRRDERGEDLYIIDYKSGSIAEAQRTGKIEDLTDLQMSIYEILQKQVSPHVNMGFLRIFEDGKIEDLTEPEEKRALLLKNIKELKETSLLIPAKTEDLKKCRFCEFQLICKRGEYL